MGASSPTNVCVYDTGNESASGVARVYDGNPKKHPSLPLCDLRSPTKTVRIQDLLLLSSFPHQRSKQISPQMIEPFEEQTLLINPRRRSKKKFHSSPRNSRNSRCKESTNDTELACGVEPTKHKKKKLRRSLKERRGSGASIAGFHTEAHEGHTFHAAGKVILDVIMWHDFSKSVLWFGCGSLFFLSSVLVTDYSYSLISAVSQMGLFVLAASFFYNSFLHRSADLSAGGFELKEDSVLQAIRVLLPTTNAAIKEFQRLFSGKPEITIKMASILLITTEFGYLLTLSRFSMIAFFSIFTLPKLYSSHSQKIWENIESWTRWVWETWSASSHKKIIVGSATIVFWNISTAKTRLYAAFMLIVMLKYYQQCNAKEMKLEEKTTAATEEKEVHEKDI